MRTIWKGTVAFGLVNIPIKLYSATQERRLNFDLLDKDDHARIRYKRVNESSGKEVDYEDIVKGYLLEDDYVILENEDFEQAGAKKSDTIEITEFVDDKDIESLYYKKPYYLEPDKGGKKAYGLLLKALEKSGKVGVATYVLRNRENLAIVKPKEDVLLLYNIRFDAEIRDRSSLELPKKDAAPSKKELDMAMSLIAQYTEDFDIDKYKDAYNEQLLKIINAKAKGKKPKVKKMHVAPTKSKDLASQLQASLDQKKKAS